MGRSSSGSFQEKIAGDGSQVIKIKLLTVHKTKENWLQDALQEYEKRLKALCQLEWILAKTDVQLEEICSKETSFIALDPQGKAFDSLQFSKWFLKKAAESKGRLIFVIGGPNGLSEACKKRASFLWSLSPLTFTGQITRLLLVEQLYRAFEIDKGTGYHK